MKSFPVQSIFQGNQMNPHCKPSSIDTSSHFKDFESYKTENNFHGTLENSKRRGTSYQLPAEKKMTSAEL